jgi:hypothetical protein
MKYFKHDLLSREDDKIWELIDSHGMQGYGIWWVILEELYKAESTDFQVEATDIWLKRLSRQLGLSDWLTMVRTLDRLAELNLIDGQLWRDRVIYAHGIAKRAEAYVKEREQGRLRKQRQREREREALMMSPRTNKTSRVTPGGQVASHRCVTTNIDLDLDIDLDQDPEVDQDLLESYIPECPDIELCSADALRDRAPISKTKEPELTEQQNTVTPLDSQAEEPSSQPKPRTRKKSTAGGKTKTKTEAQHHPEAFAKFWDNYRDHLKAIDSNVWVTQKRPEAIKVWDSLIASGVLLETILEGAQAWFDLTLRMMKAKGKVYGAPHCCRFLSGRLWESALDDKRSQPTAAPQSSARPQAKRDGQVEITGLLMELRRTVLLPDDWQARTGKQLSTQLGPEDSADYAAFLRQERDRLMSGAIF